MQGIPIDGLHAFMYACVGGHKDVVKILLDHPRNQNIEINAKDQLGKTALMHARFFGHTDVVKLLQNHLTRSKNFVWIENEVKRTRLQYS